jgi:hypothetical protein
MVNSYEEVDINYTEHDDECKLSCFIQDSMAHTWAMEYSPSSPSCLILYQF